MKFSKITGRRPVYTAQLHLIVTCCLLIAAGLLITVNAVDVSAATSYNLWVGGTRVTSDNAKATNKNWTFDYDSKTLTLNSYSYSGVGYKGKIKDPEDPEEYYYYNAAIYTTYDLTIRMTGTSTVTAKPVPNDEDGYIPYGIFSTRSLKFEGTGTLTANGGAKSECESAGVATLNGNITIYSGILYANGGTDCCSYGIYTDNTVYANGGKVYGTGGTLYAPEDNCISAGIYSSYLVIDGGYVNAKGGSAGKYTSVGFSSTLRMHKGELYASGGSAGLVSAGAYSESDDYHIILGGTANFTGGTCSKGSYGLYNCVPNYDDPLLNEDGGMDTAGPAEHIVHFTAKVTAKGNTAATNRMFDYDYYDEDLIFDYLEEDDSGTGGFIVEDDEDTDDAEDEETVVKVGSYYIYSDRYAPVINAGSNVDGTGTARYVSPDPASDIYTNRKYVNITPAVLPTSVKLSQNNYTDTKVGDTKQLTVTYTPSNADIKAVNWTASNPNIAAVTSTGLVTINGKADYGFSDITAKIGKCSDTCRVVYQKPQTVTPTIKVTYEGSEPVIRTKEGTLKVRATVTPSSYASQLKWYFYGSNDVATFDEKTGIVTGHASGTVGLRAYLSEDTSVSGWLLITINIPAEPEPDPDPQCEHTTRMTVVSDYAALEKDGKLVTTCSQCGQELNTEVIPGVKTIGLKDNDTDYEYTGQPIEPEVIVKDRTGKFLESGSDYNIKYSKNTEPGVGTVTVELCHKYTGTYSFNFNIVGTCQHPASYEEIVPAEMGKDGKILTKCSQCRETLRTEIIPYINQVGVAVRPYIYTGKPVIPEILVTDRNGNSLRAGTDYTYTCSNNKNIGTADIVFVLKGLYSGTHELKYVILPAAIDESAVQLNKKSVVFSTTPEYPETIIAKGYSRSDFNIDYINAEDMSVGEHRVVITSTNYILDKTLTYTVRPAGTKLRKLKSSNKAATVKWTKQAQRMIKSRISGYQIQYSLKKSFKNAKKVTVKGYSVTSQKIKKLKSGKTYYVRIRTYMKTGGKTYYSPWSKFKTVKPK